MFEDERIKLDQIKMNQYKMQPKGYFFDNSVVSKPRRIFEEETIMRPEEDYR